MSITVLVAEDELLIAMDIVDELVEAGFRAIGPFARIEQAMDYCRKEISDCAVLDVRLQDGECFPLADMLAAHDVPIVFHSGHASREVLAERYRHSEVCAKPAPCAKIAELVEALCKPASVPSVQG